MTSGSKKGDSRKKTHNKREDTTTTMGVKAAEVAIAFWFGKRRY
jgi:hypothetical protein